jgi:hypothetical protein
MFEEDADFRNRSSHMSFADLQRPQMEETKAAGIRIA